MKQHELVCKALQDRYGKELDAHIAEVAHHSFKAAQAGDPKRTITYMIRAAERAAEAGADQEAIRYYNRALRVAELADPGGGSVATITTALGKLSDAAATRAEKPGPAPREQALFMREGDYWSISFEGKTSRIKDIRGVGYIATLLRNPGHEIHSLDLVLGSVRPAQPAPAHDDGLSGGADAAAILDPRAKSQYRRRLAELESDIEEARAFNDSERAARSQAEMDAITAELTAALGLAGRDRTASNPGERARINVTKAIKEVLRRLQKHDPALASHFSATIRTGTFCSYRPDPRVPVQWKVDRGNPT